MDTLTDDIFVIDNIIPKDYQIWVEEIVTQQKELPWYYKSRAIHDEYQSDLRNVFGLFHYLYEEETKKSPNSIVAISCNCLTIKCLGSNGYSLI
jgi:hypothetical protein